MKCAKCGLELPPGVGECPKCGMVNEIETRPTVSKPRTRPVIYVIAVLAGVAVLALVVAVVAGLGNKNVTSVPEPVPGPPGNITTAPAGAPSGGPITSAPPGVPGPGDVSPPAAARPKPPQAVVDYLNFVKKVEEHRQMLLKDTTNALSLASSGSAQGLMDMIDMAMDPEGAKARDPLAATKSEMLRQYKNWLATLQYFDKRPAPPECRSFSGAYRDVLYRETKTIGEIAIGLKNVDLSDPKDMSRLLKSLQGMKNDPSIQLNIDKAADNADAQLSALVSQYDMEKPFDVKREQQTSGGIMGF